MHSQVVHTKPNKGKLARCLQLGVCGRVHPSCTCLCSRLSRWNFGIKKLISMADYASQAEDKGTVVDVFIKLLEEAHSQQ